MATDLPNTPTLNQVYTAPGGQQYIWDNTKWTAASSGPYLPLAGGTITPGPLNIGSILRLDTTLGLNVNFDGTTPVAGDSNKGIRISGTTGAGLSIDNFGGSGSGWSPVALRSARGTQGAFTALQSGDWLGGVGFRGATGANTWGPASHWAAEVDCITTENWTSTNQGCYLYFQITQTGGSTTTSPLKLKSGVLIGNSATEDPGDNRILFYAGALGPPTASARATGARIVLWSGGGTTPDYAIGMDTGSLWYGVPSSSVHKWYVSTTVSMMIDGNGTVFCQSGASNNVLQVGTGSNIIKFTSNAVDANYPSIRSDGSNLVLNTKTNGGLYFCNDVTGSIYIPSSCRVNFSGSTATWQLYSDNNSIIFYDNTAGRYGFWFDHNGNAFNVNSTSNASIATSGTTSLGTVNASGYCTLNDVRSNNNFFTSGGYGSFGAGVVTGGAGNPTNGQIWTHGSNAGVQFDARDNSTSWVIYNTGSTLRMWSSNDQMWLNTNGNCNINGGYYCNQDSWLHRVIHYWDCIPNTQNIYSVGQGSNCWAQVNAYAITNVSNRADKTDIEAHSPALDRVMELQPVHFHWKEEGILDPTGRRAQRKLHSGFIADEVLAVLGDNHGAYNPNDGNPGVVSHELLAILWQAVRELSAEVERLKHA